MYNGLMKFQARKKLNSMDLTLDDEQAVQYLIEFLNLSELPSMPMYELKLDKLLRSYRILVLPDYIMEQDFVSNACIFL